MKIVYFGTPLFAAKILEDLVDSGISIQAVVTKPDKPQGRSLKLIAPAVKITAQNRIPTVPLHQPEKCSTPEFAEVLKSYQADLFVVVAYGEIIKQEILDIPKLCCINVHASLLPKYRGAAPIQRCLMQGDVESGITIIKLVKKMDAGDILCIEKTAVDISTTYVELEATLQKLGTKALLKVLSDFENKQVSFIPQDEAQVTLAHKITPEECEIKWEKEAKDIHNLIRAVTPHPGAWCFLRLRGIKKRVKILQSKLLPCIDSGGNPEFYEKNNELYVSCKNGLLHILKIQIEGKPPVFAAEFLRGFPISELEIVCE